MGTKKRHPIYISKLVLQAQLLIQAIVAEAYIRVYVMYLSLLSLFRLNRASIEDSPTVCHCVMRHTGHYFA